MPCVCWRRGERRQQQQYTSRNNGSDYSSQKSHTAEACEAKHSRKSRGKVQRSACPPAGGRIRRCPCRSCFSQSSRAAVGAPKGMCRRRSCSVGCRRRLEEQGPRDDRRERESMDGGDKNGATYNSTDAVAEYKKKVPRSGRSKASEREARPTSNNLNNCSLRPSRSFIYLVQAMIYPIRSDQIPRQSVIMRENAPGSDQNFNFRGRGRGRIGQKSENENDRKRPRRAS